MQRVFSTLTNCPFHRYHQSRHPTYIALSSQCITQFSSIDFRSDTVTKPTKAMLDAMSNAAVGDDVMDEDPTVNALQNTFAQLVNKPAALFVPSGTMGNLISIASHCKRGDELICGADSHIFKYEGSGCSAYLGVGMHTLPNLPSGALDPVAISQAYRPDNVHFPRTGLVAIENTHNICGGRVFDTAVIRELANVCHTHDLPLHLDGARLANAVVALKSDFATLTQDVASLSMCLSKGLGAPVGSLIAGSESFIYHAKRCRKSLGGGWRQAGLLAAAGLHALEHHVERLVQDHELAFELATGLSKIPGVCDLDIATIDTNIVYFNIDSHVMSPEDFVTAMQGCGILLGGAYGRGGQSQLRMVTHLDIRPRDIQQTLLMAQKCLNTSS